MSTLFLIGNGFDLNCGMHTKYTDVYKEYLKSESSTECIRNFKETISSNIADWGDFEIAMAEYAMNFGTEQEFLECIRDFAKYMEKYLVEEQKHFKERVTNKQVMSSVIDEARRSLGSFYEDISHNVNNLMEQRNAGSLYNNIKVVSFNYTDTFDYILSECVSSWRVPRINVIHIHGTLGDGPVFGVDNVEQIKATFKLSNKGKRGFVKPIFNEMYDEERVRIVRNLINEANTVCVYGMSLGESDLSWRNALVDWLKQSESNHLFIYSYKLSEKNYGTVTERMDTEEDEKYKLFQSWGIDSDSQTFERVHIPCGKNIFNFNKVMKSINKEIHNKRVEELTEKLKEGENFLNQHLQEVAVTEEL